jgi:DNA end-binding protein Ku
VLVLETMFFADEIRDPDEELGKLPRKSGAGKQLSMAVDLIKAMSGEWKPAAYEDTYTERVKELVKSKHQGKEIVYSEEEPQATNPTDLVAALRASVEEARKSRSTRTKTGPAKKTAAKKTASKKTAAKKTTAKKTAAKKAAKGRKKAA